MAFALASCAGEREVMVRVPLSRLELPEQGPRMFDIALGGIGQVEAQLTGDQGNVAPDPAAPRLSEESGGLLRFDYSPHPIVTVSAKAISDLAGVQVKLMPLPGRGPFSAAVTLGVAGGDDRFDFNDGNTRAYTTTDSSVRDYALVLGARADRSLMLYGGPWFSELSYEGHHFSDRGSNPDVEFDYEGEVTARGANVGAAVSFRRWGRMLAEYSHARVEAGGVKDDLGQGSLALEIFFGPQIGPPQRPEDPPVEVVPPVERDAGHRSD